MQDKIINRKKKLVYNIIFILVTLVSIAVMVIFCIYLRKLGSLSNTLLIIIYIALGILYLILSLLIVPRKFKMNIKIAIATILIIFDFAFVFGIRKIDRTINNRENSIEENKIDNIDNNVEDSITNE